MTRIRFRWTWARSPDGYWTFGLGPTVYGGTFGYGVALWLVFGAIGVEWWRE